MGLLVSVVSATGESNAVPSSILSTNLLNENGADMDMNEIRTNLDENEEEKRKRQLEEKVIDQQPRRSRPAPIYYGNEDALCCFWCCNTSTNCGSGDQHVEGADVHHHSEGADCEGCCDCGEGDGGCCDCGEGDGGCCDGGQGDAGCCDGGDGGDADCDCGDGDCDCGDCDCNCFD